MTPCGSNVYANPNMEIILNNVLDLGIYMSGDCTFNLIFICLIYLKSVIMKSFAIRDCITLFKSTLLNLTRLDYG